LRKQLQLAIISDLHVGRRARAQDFRPDNSHAVDANYKDTFLRFIEKQRLRADYLLLPGDICNEAQPDEFVLASAIIRDLAAGLSVEPDHVLFVPGNHDVDWTAQTQYPEDRSGFRWAQRYSPLRQDSLIFERILRRGNPHMIEQPHHAIWLFDDLVVVGYNSSSHDGPTAAVHHGAVTYESISGLDDALTRLALSPKLLKVFLIHHHPISYSDPIPGTSDFSILQNAGDLIRLLHKHHFDFLVHGHKHCPRFETLDVSSSFPLAVLCAGSFSAEIDTRWSFYVTNKFHLIYIRGRNNRTGCAQGEVKSWSYIYGAEWIPSKRDLGIPHTCPFGAYIHPARVKKILEKKLRNVLERRDYVIWPDVVEAHPAFKYLPSQRLVEIIIVLAEELGLYPIGDFPDRGVYVKRGEDIV
jgi:UDP-2,3-diacylglucosamine pyrophosphatase LpxH